jgi:hypothetical protein
VLFFVVVRVLPLRVIDLCDESFFPFLVCAFLMSSGILLVQMLVVDTFIENKKEQWYFSHW